MQVRTTLTVDPAHLHTIAGAATVSRSGSAATAAQRCSIATRSPAAVAGRLGNASLSSRPRFVSDFSQVGRPPGR